MVGVVDRLAAMLLRHEALSPWLGPVAVIVAVLCALRLRRRGALFWCATATMACTMSFIAAGWVEPFILIGALCIPVVMCAALLLIVVPAGIVALVVGKRPQRFLEALYLACALGTSLSAAGVAAAASASV